MMMGKTINMSIQARYGRFLLPLRKMIQFRQVLAEMELQPLFRRMKFLSSERYRLALDVTHKWLGSVDPDCLDLPPDWKRVTPRKTENGVAERKSVFVGGTLCTASEARRYYMDG